jgi:glyoxalase family protein
MRYTYEHKKETMENRILGLHHITAIAGNARRNHDFYTKILGLRLVKKTVNFDDPGTYHFYFGDEVGSPGTILTFFPWEGIRKGRPGAGQATEITYTVPDGSLSFWKERLERSGVKITSTGKRFNEDFISFEDPDGLPLTFLVSKSEDDRVGWETDEVSVSAAPKGFHSVTLTLRRKDLTQKVLELLGYRLAGSEGNRYRYVTDAIKTMGPIKSRKKKIIELNVRSQTNAIKWVVSASNPFPLKVIKGSGGYHPRCTRMLKWRCQCLDSIVRRKFVLFRTKCL